MRHATVLGSTLAFLCALGVVGLRPFRAGIHSHRRRPARRRHGDAIRPTRPHAPGPRPARASTSRTKPAATSSPSMPTAGRSSRRLPVGKRPRGIKLSRDGQAAAGRAVRLADCRARAWTNRSFRPPTGRPTASAWSISRPTRWCATIRAVRIPEVFDLSPDGKTLYVSNEDAAQMSVVDPATGNDHEPGASRRGTRRGDGPPGRREIWVTCEGDNEVVAIDAATQQGRRHDCHRRAAAGGHLHAGRQDRIRHQRERRRWSPSLTSPATRSTTTLTIPKTEGAPAVPRPMGGVLSPDGSQLFVSLGRARSVAVIDVAARKVSRTIDACRRPPVGHQHQRRRAEALYGERAVRRRLGHRCRHRQDRSPDQDRRQPVGSRGRREITKTCYVRRAATLEFRAQANRRRFAVRRGPSPRRVPRN